ncbi:acyltransferase family protein [Neobacillus sp. BF23-41]|uniref:acyltransferase family protein n=1 Tax=Neobacillus sp. BF23-41 TaxID=3240280 RepID=UPI0034E43EEE
MIGALLAKHREYLIYEFRNLKVNYLLLFIGFLFFNYPRIPFMLPSKIIGDIDYILYQIVIDWIITIGAAIFIVFSLSSETFSKILLKNPIHFIGKISYSLYLIHPVVLLVIVHLVFNRLSIPLILLISLLITLLSSLLSYKYIEKPSIELGKYLTKQRSRNSNIKQNTPA